MAYIPYIHPIVAIAAIALCYTNAAMGITRLRPNINLLRFERGLHVNVGRSFMGLLYITLVLGFVGIISLEAGIFASPHGYFAVLLVILFSIGALLAHMILKGNTRYRKIHGRIMMTGAVLLILQILGGIWNLRIFLGLF